VPAPPPSPICEPHTGTDYVCCGLKSVLNVTTAAACCAACKAEPQCTAWKVNPSDPSNTCFLKQGKLTTPVHCSSCVVGYTEPPPSGPDPEKKPASKTWSFGVWGDVQSVPSGFKQSTLMGEARAALQLVSVVV